jgi:hypothetical protein
MVEESGDLFRGGEVKFVRVGHRKVGDPRYVVSVQIIDRTTRTQKGFATFVYIEGEGEAFIIDDVAAGTGEAEFSKGDVDLVLRDHAFLLARGDVDRAYRRHDRGYAEVIGPGAYRTFIEAEGGAFATHDFEVVEVSIEGQRAVATAELVPPEGSTAGPVRVEYELSQTTRSSWHISAMRIVVSGDSPAADGGIELK